jgi:site-specific DNA-methyltransferase (adenine-specific)
MYEVDSEAGGEILHGDCIKESEQIADGSVDLILTDPPYGTVKGAGLDGWENRTTEWDVALDPSELFNIAGDLLRQQGKLILFSQEPYTSKLVQSAPAIIPFSYRLIWVKDHFANSLIAQDSPVNLYEDIIVFTKSYDKCLNHPLRSYFEDILQYIGESKAGIIKQVGQKADHCFRVNSSQFEIPTQETYNELITTFGIDEYTGFKPYAEIESIDAEFKNQRPNVFNLAPGEKYKSNVLEYDKPQSDLHPTQKPVDLLEDLITTYTHAGDRVVDLCAGSGSTAVAAYNTGREAIGIEKSKEYYETAVNRLSELDDSDVSTTGQYNLQAYND